MSFFVLFNIAILVCIVADFILLARFPSISMAISLTIAWIALGLGFSSVVYYLFGVDHAYEYLTAYLVEKSLSVDNIFVFFMIFAQFKVERQYQHRLLFIGIWSALILRALMIFAVGEILSAFHFAIYIFGLFILYAGIQSFVKQDSSIDVKKISSLLKIKLYEGDHQGRLIVKTNGKYYLTAMTLVVCVIEMCDIVFAFDSIPALFSITSNKLIIYTSNTLAIIGMRSLYLAFATAVEKMRYLKYGVGVILCLVGLKMIFSNYIHIESHIYLIIIITILCVSVVASKIDSIKKE